MSRSDKFISSLYSVNRASFATKRIRKFMTADFAGSPWLRWLAFRVVLTFILEIPQHHRGPHLLAGCLTIGPVLRWRLSRKMAPIASTNAARKGRNRPGVPRNSKSRPGIYVGQAIPLCASNATETSTRSFSSAQAAREALPHGTFRDLEKGYRPDPEAIGRAVAEECESRA